MNKKFLSAILFGALMVTSTGTFVSCKDYDDEIDQINKELTDVKSQIAALQGKVDAGKYVTGVSASADGILVSFSDGSSAPVAVKGGAASVTIDPTTKNWLVDGTDTGVCAEGEAPTFSIGEDGHIYVQYGEAEKEDLGVCTGGIYYVEEGAKMTLHIPNAEGEYQDVVLPRAAAISNITILGAANELSWDDVSSFTIEMGIGQNKQGKAVEFNGKTYAKDALLSVAKSKVLVQVNPTMADATVYDFYLTDSKGKSIFDLGTAEAYKTVGAITRADATPNKGLYSLPVTIKAGTSYKDAVAINNNASVAYAVATKDAFDNEVLSTYKVKFSVNPNAETSFDYNTYKQVQINKAFDLTELLYMENVVDVKFSFSKAQSANVDAAQAVINGTEITGGVAQKRVHVTVEYMDLTGAITKVEDAIQVYFIASTNAQTMSAEITPTGDPKKDFVTFDLTGLSTSFENTNASVNSVVYAIKDVKFTAAAKDLNTETEYAKGAVAVGITKPASVATANAETDKTGYYKHTVTYTVDADKVIPGTYEAVITYYEQGNNEHSLTLTIVVNDPASAFDFKPLELYFTGNDAVAYGTTSKDADVISYNLKGLFGIEKWDNISFSETVPEAYKDADGNTWTAKKWLTSTFGAIEVERANTDYVFGGAYEARAMKATYQPMANKNFAAATYEYNLTIKSAVYEGSLEYVKPVANKDEAGNVINYTYLAGEAKSISVATENPSTTLKAAEIRGIDKNNVAYQPTDAETDKVQKVTVALEGDNAKQYLEAPTGNWTDGWTIKTKANVTIPSDGKTVTCYVRVSVLDQWGMTKTVDVPVTLK